MTCVQRRVVRDISVLCAPNPPPPPMTKVTEARIVEFPVLSKCLRLQSGPGRGRREWKGHQRDHLNKYLAKHTRILRTSPAVWHTERCIHMYTNGRTCRLEMVSTEHCTSCIGLPKFCSGEFPGYLLSVPGLNLRRWGLTIGHEILGSKGHLISEECSMGPSATTGCES